MNKQRPHRHAFPHGARRVPAVAMPRVARRPARSASYLQRLLWLFGARADA